MHVSPPSGEILRILVENHLKTDKNASFRKNFKTFVEKSLYYFEDTQKFHCTGRTM